MSTTIGSKNKFGMDTPAKRAKLPGRRNPYWTACGPNRGGLSVGYRKPLSGPGAWIARLSNAGVRSESRLGQADDAGGQPGALSYAGAVAAAMAWAGRQAAVREHRAAHPSAAELTVQSAIDAYVTERKVRHVRHGRDAGARIARHLPPDTPLAKRSLAALTERDLSTWVRALAGLAPASVARLINDTKAALNHAGEMHHRVLPLGWGDIVTRGLRRPPQARGAATASHQREVLTDADVRALIAAAQEEDEEGDFGRLVAVLAATGARFSQAARMTVADVVAGPTPRLMMPASAKGRPGMDKPRHQPIQIGADIVVALASATRGRAGSEILLMRWHHRQEPGEKATARTSTWMREKRVPWNVAADMARPWARTVARAGLSAAITPYRLRDASIIRGLRAGLPVHLVAKLHDTSAAMVAKHYAADVTDALSDVARLAVVPLMATEPSRLRSVG